MSHFSVLVVTDERPENDVLTRVLLPFHEYECTGYEDYVVDVDVTDEVIADHAEYGDGETLDAEWAKGWNGSFVRDGRYYRRTNPNAHWDWWVLGGRYRGMLKVHSRADTLVGRPGVDGNGPMLSGGVDACQVRELDLRGMQDEIEAHAAERFDKFHAVLAGRALQTWDEVFARHGEANIDAAREEYHAQSILKELRDAEVIDFFDDPKPYMVPREKYLADTRNRAGRTFAVVRDGKWYERGKMGWWGIVTDEKDQDAWNEEFAKLLAGLPQATWLSVVDCHI